MAAKVDRVDQAYFEQAIQPLLDLGVVEFIGEIGETDKADFLGNAKALLFPIDWPEPFDLALIEEMACGTPVVAFRAGSVPEILEPGRTGYVVDTLDEAVARTLQIDRLDRETVRAEFEARFTSDRMAEDYLSIYAGVITAQHADARRPGTGPCPVPGRMPEGR
jgi:glycosyltransferase involved in cell wall biosynthesis